MRTLAEIENTLVAGLAKANTPVTDLTSGSVLSALIRALASLHLEQDNRISRLSRSLNIGLASGFELDTLAENFGLFRKASSPSVGQVVLTIESGQATIVPGTLLTNFTSGIQYAVNIENDLILSPLEELAVPVISLSQGEASNLPSGTKLSVAQSSLATLPIVAVVGYKRASDGSYCGDLTEGKDEEEDEEFRARILTTLVAKDSSSSSSIEQRVLELDFVRNAWVITPTPGVLEVIVKTDTNLDNTLVSLIKEQIASIVPAGIYTVITQNKPSKLDFTLQVKPYLNTDLVNLKSNLSLLIAAYLNNLEVGRSFSLVDLTARLSALALSVRILEPTEIPQGDKISYEIGRLNICYVD